MSILSLSFSGMMKNLTCCTDQGYIIFSLNPNLERRTQHTMPDGGVGLMRTFKETNISLLVGGGPRPFKSKDNLVLWDDKVKKSVLEIDMKEQIKNALLTQNTLISIVERNVYIFDWSGNMINMKSTYANDKGLCAVTEHDSNVTLAMLGIKKGEIAVWNPTTDIYKIIEAHKSNISALTINYPGTLVATASEIGTLIRIFNTNTGKLEFEFRRGSSVAKVHDLCFNKESTLLACYSGNGTAHIYELYKDINNTKNTQSMLSGFKGVLPNYFGSQWGFKQVNIGDTSRAICSFDDENNLHIATYNGNYYNIIGKTGTYDTIKKGVLHTKA